MSDWKHHGIRIVRLDGVLVRNGQEPIVVNLDIAPAEPPETVRWVDPNHPV